LTGRFRKLTPLFFIPILLCASILICCGGSGPTTLKIGAILSLTGPASIWGLGWQNGIELAVAELNGQGGVTVDGQTHPIEVIYYDDHYDPTEATTAINKLISEDQVKFVIGPMSADAMIAVAPIIEEAQLPVLGGGSAPATLGPDKPHMFAILPSARETQPAVHVWVLQSYPDAKTWYGIVPDNATGRSDRETITPIIEGLGWQILGWELYDPATTDFTPLLTTIMAQNPDMIDTCSSPPGQFSIIWKQLYELGYRGLKLACASGEEPSELLAQIGASAAEGGIMSWFDYSGNEILPGELTFRDKCVTRFGSTGYDISSALRGGWDAVMLLVEAMKEARTIEDTSAVTDCLADIQVSLPDGVAKFGGTQTYGIKRMLIKDVMVGQWRGGQYHNEMRITSIVP